jgi:lysozyme family protein
MTSAFDHAHAIVLANEGGYLSEAEARKIGDRGGATMWGISQSFLDQAGIDVRAHLLSTEQAREIYWQHFFRPIRESFMLSVGLGLCLYDFSVQSGPARAVRHLQRVVDARCDGVYGPETVRMVDYHGLLPTLLDLSARRRSMLRHWIAKDARREAVRDGVMYRVDKVLSAAFQWIADEPSGQAFRRFEDLWRNA